MKRRPGVRCIVTAACGRRHAQSLSAAAARALGAQGLAHMWLPTLQATVAQIFRRRTLPRAPFRAPPLTFATCRTFCRAPSWCKTHSTCFWVSRRGGGGGKGGGGDERRLTATDEPIRAEYVSRHTQGHTYHNHVHHHIAPPPSPTNVHPSPIPRCLPPPLSGIKDDTSAVVILLHNDATITMCLPLRSLENE